MALGQLLGALGRFLAALGRFLNAFFLPEIPRAWILEGLGVGRAWFWKASGTYFGMRFAAPRTLKLNACFQCRNHVFLVSRRFAFFPFRCGGQCAAHPPPPEGMPCVPDINAFILSVPASKLNASELGFRFLARRLSPILIFLPPDPHGPPSRPKN